MSNEKSFKEKLIHLEDCMPEIIDCVKKDLKSEHLKKDYNFSKKYFPGKNINKIENQEFIQGYLKALHEEAEAESLAEFIVHHWIFKNSELYHFFEERLSKINPDFTEIKELTTEQANALEKEAFKDFGVRKTYIFSQLNGVAFSPDHMKKMAVAASKERAETAVNAVQEAETRSLDEMKAAHALEIARLTDKYEKKLLGVQKKYAQDVEALKKQISTLHRKMASV
jgi:hypothetical protein